MWRMNGFGAGAPGRRHEFLAQPVVALSWCHD
jgi:hypothetical protein